MKWLDGTVAENNIGLLKLSKKLYNFFYFSNHPNSPIDVHQTSHEATTTASSYQRSFDICWTSSPTHYYLIPTPPASSTRSFQSFALAISISERVETIICGHSNTEDEEKGQEAIEMDVEIHISGRHWQYLVYGLWDLSAADTTRATGEWQ